MSAKKVQNQNRNSCLVVSHNGDGESLMGVLRDMGFSPVPSGTGREGVAAIGHYQPEVVIVFVRPKEPDDDVMVLRAIQDFRQKRSFKGAVVIGTNPQAVQTVKSLLRPPDGCRRRERCWVLSSTNPDGLAKAILALAR